MRTGLALWIAVTLLALVAGCSDGASEDKPLDEVRAEAQEMNAEQLQAKIDEYTEAIEAKKPEVERLQKELGTGLAGALTGEKPENAEQLKADLAELETSLRALQERMQIYAEELQRKQAS